MLVYSLAEAEPRKVVAYGATLGQEHIRPLREALMPAQNQAVERVILDFDGIEAATNSYVKATVLWLYQCSQLAAGVQLEINDHDPFRPIPLDVVPFAARMHSEVRSEVDEVFSGRKLACLEAMRWDDEKVLTARLLGEPEDTVRRTLEFLIAEREATATMLHERHPAERITVNGWNNRLADLYGLRLASRTRQGRQWLYVPVAEEVHIG